MGALFVPALGNAPKFCHFIENITEEMEETTNQQVFSDFKFITHEELLSLDSLHLLESGKVQPHMHGYLIPYQLYTFLQSNCSLLLKYMFTYPVY